MEINSKDSNDVNIQAAQSILVFLEKDLSEFNKYKQNINQDYIQKSYELIEKINTLRSSKNSSNDSSKDYDILAEIELFSDLNNIITEIKEIAKFVFSDSPEKLSNYIIMNKSIEKPTKIIGLEYSHSTENFTWKPNSSSNLYQLQFSKGTINDELNWEEAFMGPVTNLHFVPEESGDYCFRVLGFNDSGLGEPSDVLELYFGRY